MRLTIVLIGLLALLVGCGESSKAPPAPAEASPPAAAPQAEAPPAHPAQSAGTVAPANTQANIDAVLQDLTQRVRKYGVEKMKAPTDLAELVANGYLDRIPEAPAGKRFAIDKKLQVYLAD